MAIYLNKMNKKRTLDLTKAMINSVIALICLNQWHKADKHSTGGVGDITTF